MTRKIACSLLLLILVTIGLNSKTKVGLTRYPSWIVAKIVDSKPVKLTADFTHVLSNSSTAYIGYIGNNYQKFDISLQSVHKSTANRYTVTGVTMVRTNRCNFQGTIDVVENRQFSHPTFGLDNSMKGQFKCRGCTIAKYRFAENAQQKGSGVFVGYLLFYWYETNKGEIVYDDIDDFSDSYSNNQYAGTWQSYATKKSKPCAWGQYRVPNSGDLDVGAAEFSVNPKYARNGWSK